MNITQIPNAMKRIKSSLAISLDFIYKTPLFYILVGKEQTHISTVTKVVFTAGAESVFYSPLDCTQQV